MHRIGQIGTQGFLEFSDMLKMNQIKTLTKFKMKQPYGHMSTKRVPPMSLGATNTQSLLRPTKFSQIQINK